MTWVLFWDMHSGGATKLPPYNKIYVEAPEDAARSYFQRKFGRDPENVTCSCCGEDYSVSQSESFLQASGYHRNLRYVEPKRVDGRYVVDDPNAGYIEEDAPVPEGYSTGKRFGEPLTEAEYLAKPDVLVVRGDEVLALLRSPQDPTPKEKP